MDPGSILRRVVRAGCAALALLAGCGGGGPGPQKLSLGTAVLVADADGDGRADVLTLHHLYGDQPAQGRLTVRRQTAPGVFAPPRELVAGCYPWSMQLADLDGDGRPDLVVSDVGDRGCTDATPGHGIYVFLQDAASPGRFLPGRRLQGDYHTYTVAVGDFDDDGLPDLAFGDGGTGSPRLLVLAQDALHRGRFRAPQSIDLPGVVSIPVAGDIDGDGRSDLLFQLYDATASPSQSTLAVLLQQPGGGFGALQQTAPQTGLNGQRLAIADADGDGRPDLIAHFNPSSTDFLPKLTAARQGATPSAWRAPVDTSLAGVKGLDGSAIADLDGDGRADVVTVGTYPIAPGPKIESRINVFRAFDGARYERVASTKLDIQGGRVAAGDLDGDGRIDLVVYDTDRTLVWLRQTATAGVFDPPRPLR